MVGKYICIYCGRDDFESEKQLKRHERYERAKESTPTKVIGRKQPVTIEEIEERFNGDVSRRNLYSWIKRNPNKVEKLVHYLRGQITGLNTVIEVTTL